MSRKSLRATKQPESPIEFLAAGVREYLHMPDPSALYVLMGAVAANLMDGYPTWLMLVGAPGCGKTELINMLLDLPHIHELANISGEASFLSGTAKKDIAKDATGGILRMVGDHGAVLMNDFTSVLSLPSDVLKRVLAVFRECFSGRWTRSVGSEGGRTIQWTGKVMFLGGVTGEIDRHHQVNASLGERWIYYRMDGVNGFAQAKQALGNGDKQAWQQNLRSLTHAFFESLELGFGKKAPRRPLTDAEMVRTICLSGVAARCRSAVSRDPYTKEIISVPEIEVESRIATSLGQLLLGMDYIGVPEADRWRLLGKVALDSMPRLRRMIVTLAAVNGGTNIRVLTEKIGCSKSVIGRAVEELEIFGILDKGGKHLTGLAEDIGKQEVGLSNWMVGELKKGWRLEVI